MNQRELRLLFLVAGAIVFFDTMFYAAVVPLLPTLTRRASPDQGVRRAS